MAACDEVPIRALTLPAWCMGMFGNNAFMVFPYPLAMSSNTSA